MDIIKRHIFNLIDEKLNKEDFYFKLKYNIIKEIHEKNNIEEYIKVENKFNEKSWYDLYLKLKKYNQEKIMNKIYDKIDLIVSKKYFPNCKLLRKKIEKEIINEIENKEFKEFIEEKIKKILNHYERSFYSYYEHRFSLDGNKKEKINYTMKRMKKFFNFINRKISNHKRKHLKNL